MRPRRPHSVESAHMAILDPRAADLILVRHAAPEIDQDRPPQLWHLSSQGMAATVALAAYLEPLGPDRIVTSTAPKAFETGRILAEHLAIGVLPAAGFEEQHRRAEDWLPSAAFARAVEQALEAPDELVFGHETMSAARQRFEAALEGELASGGAGETLVVVTHGSVLSAFVARLTGAAAFALWRSLPMPSFVVLAGRDWRPREVAGSAWPVTSSGGLD
jgi:broad specificity phosphatase PhoE